MTLSLERADSGIWRCHTKVEKYEVDALPLDPGARKRFAPVETLEVVGNLLTTAGVNRMLSLLTGQGGTALSNANAHLGVGNGTGTATAGDTDLSGASKTRKAMRTGSFPSVPAAAAVQFSSDFLTGEANYAWNEWGIFDASTAGMMFNHKYETLGTKSSGTWTLTVTISIS